jgi:hypothetical protein
MEGRYDMNKRQWLWTIVLSAILVLPLLLTFFHQNTTHKTSKPPQQTQAPTQTAPQPQSQNEGNSNGKPSDPNPPKPPQTVWGVDSASKVDQAFLKCVNDHFGKPEVVGRYLETKEGISVGLTTQEVSYLHSQGTKIIPIFNHFTDATSYQNGVAEAKEAIAYSQKIGIPKGVAIFADIEPKYPVDDAFISGWADTMAASPYKPGIYGVFAANNKIVSDYQTAASKNTNVKSNTIIWSSNPQPGITNKDSAPSYNPKAPGNMKISIWQYGMDAKTCNIDSDLIQGEILSNLW